MDRRDFDQAQRRAKAEHDRLSHTRLARCLSSSQRSPRQSSIHSGVRSSCTCCRAQYTALVALVASTLDSIDPVVVLFGSIGLVLVPLELGYLAFEVRRTTGSWSPLTVVNFRERISGRRLVLLTSALATWFLAALIVSIAVLDEWLVENVFAWMPETLRGFAAVDEGDDDAAGGMIVVFLAIALAFNGIAGPVTEELYFRGHLLPRLQRFGRMAPVINTVLFGVYHFFSPWRYPAIIVGFLPSHGWFGGCARSMSR